MKIIQYKKVLFFAGLLFCFFVFTPKTYAGILTKPANNLGLVGYWSFNEGTTTKATDFSGRGNMGTLTNISAPATASSGWTSGKYDTAISFDGTDDFVDMGTNSSMDPTTSRLTMSAWVYYTTNGTTAMVVVSKDTNAADSDFFMRIQNPSTGVVRCSFEGTGGADSSAGVVSPNVWQLITCVFDGTNRIIYKNGVAVDTVAAVPTFSSSGGNVSIGRRNEAGGGLYYAGKIDEVRLYNRNLSATEVLNLYNSGLAKINSSQNNFVRNGLVGWWTFDGADVTDKVYDRSGQGNNAYHLGRATSTAKTVGKIGQTFDFDGSTDYVRIGNPSVLNNLGPVTYSFWVYPRTMGGGGRGHIISKTDAGGASTGAALLSMSNLFSEAVNFLRVTTGTVVSRTSAVGTVPLNTWSHVILTWDGSVNSNNVHIYVNGVETAYADTSTASGVVDSDAGNSYLIGIRGFLDRAFDGKIDDVRIYNRVLSTEEIKQVYNSTSGSKVNASQNTQYSTGLNSGLIGYWPLNGTDVTDKVYDRSGSNQNGYYNGRATSTAKVAGKVGQGLSFNGTTDSVIVPDSASLDVSTFSVSLWFNADNFNNFGRLAGRWGNTDLIWIIDTTNTGEFYYEIDTDGGLFGECGNNNTTDAQLVPKTWYHVVLTYDGTTSRIYKNGSKLNADDPCAGPFTGTARLHFGGDLGEYFPGKIDEVRYYNRALSASEIKQLYLMGR